MTGQQYRVIADRDRGDDPQWDDVEDGDHMTVIATPSGTATLVRIERPLLTTDSDGDYSNPFGEFTL